jgi:hypothetical protein
MFIGITEVTQIPKNLVDKVERRGLLILAKEYQNTVIFRKM